MMKSALLENVSSELVKRLFNHGKLIKKSMPSLMNELRDHKKVNVETTIKDPNKQLLGYLKKKNIYQLSGSGGGQIFTKILQVQKKKILFFMHLQMSPNPSQMAHRLIHFLKLPNLFSITVI